MPLGRRRALWSGRGAQRLAGEEGGRILRGSRQGEAELGGRRRSEIEEEAIEGTEGELSIEGEEERVGERGRNGRGIRGDPRSRGVPLEPACARRRSKARVMDSSTSLIIGLWFAQER